MRDASVSWVLRAASGAELQSVEDLTISTLTHSFISCHLTVHSATATLLCCVNNTNYQPQPLIAISLHASSSLTLSSRATQMSRRSFGGGRGHGKRGRDRSDHGGGGGGGAVDDRDDASNSSGPLRQREAYMRMNFLYQAAHLTATGPAACLPLSRFYAATMRKIGTRLTIRSSPPVKSDTCKVCYSLLAPTPMAAAVAGGGSEGTIAVSGAVLDLTQIGSSVSLQTSSATAEPALIRTCRCCGTQRRVGLKRRTRWQAATAVAAAAREGRQPTTQPWQKQQMTPASGTPQPVEHTAAAAATAPPIDADAMR